MARSIKPVPFPSRESSEELSLEFMGKMVEAKRKSIGMSIHQAALFCNVPVNTFTKIENNRGGITLDSFLRIANGLGFQINFAEEGTDETQN